MSGQPPLKIGLVGSGFIANFHLTALQAVRDCQVTRVFSPTSAHREAAADLANKLGLGPCLPSETLESLVCSDEVDAVWLLVPNHVRLEVMQEIHALVVGGRASLAGIACEKPLARTVPEASEMLRLVEEAQLNHAYLENQIYAPSVTRGRELLWARAAAIAGRPYLARTAEEHSGPHSPWFWRAGSQGGGVLLDMLCHSVEVGRHMLTEPGKERATLRPVAVTATTASVKWSLPEYVEQWRRNAGLKDGESGEPAEDMATGVLELEDPAGRRLFIEARTSWVYVGPGLRIQIEVLGPEYSLAIDTLQSPLSLFLSRAIAGAQGEDLVEKQNAEQGLMPVVDNEPETYGYVAENRDVVQAFLHGTKPALTFDDGLAVVELLMGFYKSADLGRKIVLPDDDLATYVPSIASRALANEQVSGEPSGPGGTR